MLVLTQKTAGARDSTLAVATTLWLTAEERTRSRYRYDLADGQTIFLQLPRGSLLQDGDILESPEGERVRIKAKPEPVFTLRATEPLGLLLAAYHLGNRHVPLEVTEAYLRLAPDPVLKQLLVEQLPVTLVEEIAPFTPQPGVYHRHP